MNELVQVLGEHLPAVERDLIVAGLHLYDIGTPRLSWAELQSFVMAAPPGTAIHTSRTDGWNSEQAKLAAMQALQYARNRRGGVGLQGAGQQPSGGWDGKDGRGRNLRSMRADQAVYNPNVKVTKLLGKVTPIPLDKFKERMAEINANRPPAPEPKKRGA